jgi:hypothetical protein
VHNRHVPAIDKVDPFLETDWARGGEKVGELRGCAVGILLILTPVVSPGAEVAEQPSRSVERALQRFLERPDEPVSAFRVRRTLRSEGLGRSATMEVLVELDPEEGFRWEVLSEEGSKTMRNKGFRGMLKREARAYEEGDASRSSLTPANYLLSVEGEAPDGRVRLRAQPRRKEKTLIDGTFLVTAEDADLVEVQGRLAKGPSFWTPRVDVVRSYRRVQGHRVMVRMESVAKIRLLGEVRMVAEYDYEMIDGDEITQALPSAQWVSVEAPSGYGGAGGR